MLSSQSVLSQTRFYPLIGPVAFADTRKPQPPIDYRPTADLQKATAETRPSGRVRWRRPPCSAGCPRSQAETNGLTGPELDSPAISPRELGSPTRPARPPLP
ncbi:hypothetical protein DPMN_034144 [Dreissena polymorpha]|uniref:Uncharacterized protein n=1 Tax=Dreissena polymorpha TaxID=45954 RepID=A0A9D4M7B9_DREPO|nr:hypothetical protein DPMN_034144 [Dreissena polymorpha]